MPIHIDDFEEADSSNGKPTNAERVLRFLLANRNQAFRASEIAERVDVHPNSIHPVLGRLESRGLVRHKRPYWALGDLSDVQSALDHHRTVEFLDDRLGAESRKDWLDAAAGDSR